MTPCVCGAGANRHPMQACFGHTLLLQACRLQTMTSTLTASLSANVVIQVAANLIRPVVEQAASGHAGLSLLLDFCIKSDHKYLLQRATHELGHKNVLHMLVRLSIQLASAGHLLATACVKSIKDDLAHSPLSW